MKPILYPVSSDDPTEESLRRNEPSGKDWAAYDDWKMFPKTDQGVWRYWNSRYTVIVRVEKQSLVKCKCYRMLIIRSDQSCDRDWRDYMQIKEDIFGPEAEAIELYPARSRENDPSNAFVLFVFEKKLRIGDFKDCYVLPNGVIGAPQRDLDLGGRSGVQLRPRESDYVRVE